MPMKRSQFQTYNHNLSLPPFFLLLHLNTLTDPALIHCEFRQTHIISYSDTTWRRRKWKAKKGKGEGVCIYICIIRLCLEGV